MLAQNQSCVQWCVALQAPSLLGAQNLVWREKSCTACSVLDCFHASGNDGMTEQSLKKHTFDQDIKRINRKNIAKWAQDTPCKFRHL